MLTTAAVSVGSFIFAELAGLLLLRAGLLAGSSSRSGIRVALAHPLGLAILLITVALFAGAALEFSRRGQQERDRILPLLAGAGLLLAAARLYSLALPSVSPEAISLREVLRLLAFGFILTAALRRDFELRAAAARIAAAAERYRVAQDLHDGIAQDLAFIAAHGAMVSEQLGHEHPLALAARHALAVSRGTISDLSDYRSSSTREKLEAIAYDLGARYQTHVMVEVAPGVADTPDTADQVARIMREAIANAARHGAAKHIFVSLKQIDGASVLRVVDDGCGIAGLSGTAPEGFGIRSMRERAAALGGSLTFGPTGGRGTDLQVVFR
jgi:signal transduction histidine kinase